MFKRNFYVAFLLALFMAVPAHAASPSVLISELQTGTTHSLSEEFVELYNPLDSDVVADGWILEYKSATGASWSKKATLVGTIKAHGFFLLAPSVYLPTTDGSFAAGLSGTAGHVRIKDSAGIVIDTLGWGSTASAPETAAAVVPAAGQSLERLPGRLIEDGGNATDSDDNSKDFIVRPGPLPQSSLSPIEPPSLAVPVSDTEVTEDEAGPTVINYLPLMITELLVDPMSPALDSKDEFIELYNANSTAVDLKGYTLRAGSNFHDYYVLPAQVMEPGTYVVLSSAQTHISLTNTGGAVQLLDPTGTVVYQTGVYAKALTGASWSWASDEWAWSLQLTPATDNVLVEPPIKEEIAAKPKTTTAAKTANTTTKPKATKAAAEKKPAAAKTAKAKVAAAVSPLVAAATSPTGGWLLLALAALTLGYAGYEFRYDIQNYYIIGRRKLSAWRASR